VRDFETERLGGRPVGRRSCVVAEDTSSAAPVTLVTVISCS
jgi:hypothetical protein